MRYRPSSRSANRVHALRELVMPCTQSTIGPRSPHTSRIVRAPSSRVISVMAIGSPILVEGNSVPRGSERLAGWLSGQSETAAMDFAADVRSGLNAQRKRLSPRFLYDDLGSA